MDDSQKSKGCSVALFCCVGSIHPQSNYNVKLIFQHWFLKWVGMFPVIFPLELIASARDDYKPFLARKSR